jgi:hypothetical protein
MKTACLINIFQRLKKVNSSTRRKNENILTPSDEIATLNDKRELSEIKVTDETEVMFPKTSEKEIKT